MKEGKMDRCRENERKQGRQERNNEVMKEGMKERKNKTERIKVK